MIPVFIRSERVLYGGKVRPGVVVVEKGRIVDVRETIDIPASATVHDYGRKVVFPGLIDAHVHLNEPGRTEWEGFETATQAAAVGGVTTLADMPLNSSPVTITAAALRQKRDAARGKLFVDVAFHGGLVAGSALQVPALVAEGVTAVKAFMVHSGIDDFPASTQADLRKAMELLAPTGVPLLVHAEMDPPEPVTGASTAHGNWLVSRPAEMEAEAIALLGKLAGETRAHVHIVHVSSKPGVELISTLKQRGVRITAETCPHYLTFSSEEIPDGATEYKCAPPIREQAHREALWEALISGTLDLVATDHSPSPPEMKSRSTGDFFQAWGGIASLQFLLPAVWTGAAARGISLGKLGEWLCEAPARLLGLHGTKGSIAIGMDADLHVWDPEAEFVVNDHAILHRHKLTPYIGRTLRGRPIATYLRGELVAREGRCIGGPTGQWVKRPLVASHK